MKDLGEGDVFLGSEINHTLESLFISQTKYIMDIIQEANLLDAKPSYSLSYSVCKIYNQI